MVGQTKDKSNFFAVLVCTPAKSKIIPKSKHNFENENENQKIIIIYLVRYGMKLNVNANPPND